MTEEHKEKGTITIKKDMLWKVGTFVFAALFVILLIVSLKPTEKVIDDSEQKLSGVPLYKQYAQEFNLDSSQFNNCLDSGKYAENVKVDLQYGASLGVRGTPGFFINGIAVSGAQPFSVFQQIIEEELNNPGNGIEVEIGDSPVKGDANAPITIVEFSDFQCPFCARFYTQTLGQIEREYIDTGKVKLVYKDFPLNSIHPNAQKAAEAARCAGEQNKFWEYHDKLFEFGV